MTIGWLYNNKPNPNIDFIFYSIDLFEEYRMHNILVIDDEKTIVSILTMALTKFGFNVETAGDGLEGIKKFDECNFDLVITDICMPALDGNGVVKHIRNSEKRYTPVIGMSGTPWLLVNGDFDAVLSKPTSIKTLVDTVKNVTHPN
ncbi:MAG: response regulator [Deltaproteobacteria bacterium]|nr:response regulator [Deltaproteobacteria bacterium]